MRDQRVGWDLAKAHLTVSWSMHPSLWYPDPEAGSTWPETGCYESTPSDADPSTQCTLHSPHAKTSGRKSNSFSLGTRLWQGKCHLSSSSLFSSDISALIHHAKLLPSGVSPLRDTVRSHIPNSIIVHQVGSIQSPAKQTCPSESLSNQQLHNASGGRTHWKGS